MSGHDARLLTDAEKDTTDCHFCGREMKALSLRRQHEALHITRYSCDQCPETGWVSRQRAREHAAGHTIRAIYHPPRPLSDQVPLLERWNNINPSVTLRRIDITPNTPTPELSPKITSPCVLPPEQPASTIDLTLDDLPRTVTDATDPMAPWTNSDLSATLDDLLELLGDCPPEPAAHIIHAADTVQNRLQEARRDMGQAMALFSSAQRHLEAAEAVAVMEGDDCYIIN